MLRLVNSARSGNTPGKKPYWVFALASIVPHEGLSRENSDDDDAGVELEIAYTADAWKLASGDGGKEVRYLDNLDIVLNADLEDLVGVSNTTISLYGLYNNGAAFTDDIVGDVMAVSNIEAPVEAFRLYEAWIEHRFGGGPVSARFGLYDLNSEFDALEAASFFMSGAHGIGVDISQSGETGPSIFPITSLALRLEYEVSDSLTFRTAILDGAPGDPDNLKKTTVSLSGDDGALIIAEGDYRRESARLLAGYWQYTSPFDHHNGVDDSKSRGAYIRGESILFERADGEGRLAGFFRAGWANGDVNEFSSFYSAGLVYDAPFLASGEDQIGIAIAHARASNDFLATNLGLTDSETAFEFSYRAPLTEWLGVQPNIQYIINPGLDPVKRDALAVGLRVELGWSRGFVRH